MQNYAANCAVVFTSRELIEFIPVPPSIVSRQDVVYAAFSQKVVLECVSEAHPESTNYWVRGIEFMQGKFWFRFGLVYRSGQGVSFADIHSIDVVLIVCWRWHIRVNGCWWCQYSSHEIDCSSKRRRWFWCIQMHCTKCRWGDWEAHLSTSWVKRFLFSMLINFASSHYY